MLIFSEVHNWRNSECIKQIQVFTSEFAKSAFDAAYASATRNGTNTAAIKKFSDSGKGVAYKIRAVRGVYGDGISVWVPMIRCGHTGCIIWESNITQNTWQEAMAAALGKFQVLLVEGDFSTIWSKRLFLASQLNKPLR